MINKTDHLEWRTYIEEKDGPAEIHHSNYENLKLIGLVTSELKI